LIVGLEQATIAKGLPGSVYRMLFTNIPGNRLRAGRALRRRDELLRDILADFRRTFPELLFELDQASPTVNAQAIVRIDRRVVRIYGGLAYHAHVGVDGLIFTLLHETGHHLSSGGRLALREDLACECAADCWALTEGAARLKEETGRTFVIGEAIRSLDQLTQPCGGGTKADAKLCWSMNWSRRKRALAGPESARSVRRCHLPEFFASAVNYI